MSFLIESGTALKTTPYKHATSADLIFRLAKLDKIFERTNLIQYKNIYFLFFNSLVRAIKEKNEENKRKSFVL
jgi:hypothetical protein